MIFDSLENAPAYFPLGDNFRLGLNYLKSTDFKSVLIGKYDIVQGVFALVSEYSTKTEIESKWEAHRKYADIQYVVEGCEQMGFSNVNELEAISQYDAERDIQWFEGSGQKVLVKPGSFVIFMPHDAHMPGLFYKTGGRVKKVVVKIEV